MSNKNKHYSEAEDVLLQAAYKVAEQTGINRGELSQFLSPIMKRTASGIMFKLHQLAQKDDKKRDQRISISKQEKISDIQTLKSNTQIIESHEPMEHMDPIPLKDVGKRLKVKVYNVKPYGAFCKTEDGKSGLILKMMISTNYVENVHDYLQVGDELLVLVVEDLKTPGKTLLNAKAIGSIIPINER